jgi:hypothetical protein
MKSFLFNNSMKREWDYLLNRFLSVSWQEWITCVIDDDLNVKQSVKAKLLLCLCEPPQQPATDRSEYNLARVGCCALACKRLCWRSAWGSGSICARLWTGPHPAWAIDRCAFGDTFWITRHLPTVPPSGSPLSVAPLTQLLEVPSVGADVTLSGLSVSYWWTLPLLLSFCMCCVSGVWLKYLHTMNFELDHMISYVGLSVAVIWRQIDWSWNINCKSRTKCSCCWTLTTKSK